MDEYNRIIDIIKRWINTELALEQSLGDRDKYPIEVLLLMELLTFQDYEKFAKDYANLYMRLRILYVTLIAATGVDYMEMIKKSVVKYDCIDPVVLREYPFMSIIPIMSNVYTDHITGVNRTKYKS